MQNEAFLSKIQELGKQDCFDFSKNLVDGDPVTIFKVEGLTALDIKNLIQTTLDTNLISGTKFNNYIDNLIQAAVGEAFSEFTIWDRVVFVLLARSHAIGNVIEDQDGTLVANIEAVLKLLKKQAKKVCTHKIIETDTMTVELEIPTLVLDKVISSHIASITAKTKTENADSLVGVIGEVLIAELAKHVKSVTLKEGDIFDTAANSPADTIKIVEALPGKVVGEIMQFVEQIKVAYESCLKSQNGSVLPINGTLFFSKIPTA